LSLPSLLRCNKKKGNQAKKLQSPSLICCKKKKATTTMLLSPSLLPYKQIKRRRQRQQHCWLLCWAVAKWKKKAWEGAYLKLSLWVQCGSCFRRSGAPSSSVLASSFKRVHCLWSYS
jgi:hypothetical protein